MLSCSKDVHVAKTICKQKIRREEVLHHDRHKLRQGT